MSGSYGAQGHADVDADAVCGQCGTVNPEGTLICKTCGNNLRDQRTLRMAAEQVLDGADAAENRRVLLSGLLSVMGILLVLLIVLNLDGVTSWLIQVQDSEVASIRGLWSGEDSSLYESLLTDLGSAQISEDAMANARFNPDSRGDVTGLMALYANERLIGTANVDLQGEHLYFVARMLNSDVEFRGHAQVQGAAYAVFEGNAGAMFDGDYVGVVGLARPMAEGGFECFGQSLQTEQNFRFECYPLAAP